MKILILLSLTFAVVYAGEAELISHESNVEYDGKYHYHYEIGDGSKATQDGVLKHITAENDGEAIEGKFAFISDDGKEYSVSYIADENGYQPIGAHLPTPPPVPESVLKALKYIEEHPYKQPANRNY